MEVCFDDVELVGAVRGAGNPGAEERVRGREGGPVAAAAELGLTEKEPRSYLGMVLEAQKKRAMTPHRHHDRRGPRRGRDRARAGKTVGLVPTMGALHEGHAALIRAARAASGFVVVSIFVNPTQFGPNEDFAKYPRTLEADRKLCAEAGADLIFAPAVDEMYPERSVTFVEVTELDDVCAARAGRGTSAASARSC